MTIRIKGFDGVELTIREGLIHIVPNRSLDTATAEELGEWREYHDSIILPEERGGETPPSAQ